MATHTKKITKAVIPAAGLGTRMLPISKAVPKEMLPIVDRPTLSFLVDEAIQSGITDILIITGRGKGAIEDYFDHSPEYEIHMQNGGKADRIPALRATATDANIFFIRQKEAKGLGHAVARAESFVGDDPFVVLYGDDLILSKTPAARQLIDVYEKTGLSVAGVKTVSDELIQRYCTLDAKMTNGGYYTVTNMIEKPKPEQIITNLAILGRVVLTPDIFDILRHTEPGAGGELQLTDAMAELARTKTMAALEFEGERYDLGSKLGFLRANVVAGVEHPETGAEFRAFLKEFVQTLA